MVKPKVNLKLLPIKAHYFFFNAGTAPLMPFIPVYAKQLGISQMGVGVMYAILPFIGLIVKPTVGALADKFRAQKSVFILSIALTSVAFFSMWFIPKPEDAKVELELDCTHLTYLRTCKVFDQCALAKLTMGYEPNDTVTCHLNCPAQETQQLCSSWPLPSCDNSTYPSDELVSISATAALHHIEHEGECLFVKVSKVETTHGSWDHPHCLNRTVAKCHVICDNKVFQSYLDGSSFEVTPTYSYHSTQFLTLMCLLILAWAAMAVTTSMADSVCFQLLESKPHNYGQQRLWGALGWGAASILAGYLIDYVSVGLPEKNYTPSFILLMVFLMINFWIVLPIDVTYHPAPPTLFRDFLVLLQDASVLLFLGACVAFGMCLSLVWQFLFWFLEDLAMNQSCNSVQWIKLLQGLVMGMQCFAGEAPFLFLSGWILKRLGHVHTMTIILVAMGVRLLAYSFLTNPWLVIPIELFQGITLGVFWATMASYASLMAPKGGAATMQGLVSAVFEGIGTSIGSFLGGTIYQSYGGVATFRAFGIMGVIVGILYGLANLLLRRKRNRERKEERDALDEMSSEESYTRVAFSSKRVVLPEDGLELRSAEKVPEEAT